MIVATWNVRGMQQPSRHAAVVDIIISNRVDVMGLLETKMVTKNCDFFLRNYFLDWKSVNNSHAIRRGHMLPLWNPAKADVEIIKVEA
ncbi:hypothetical protein AAHA92_33882 [Salvia divinorum]|uniref:Uncharacterized protein n=1 Tax=Salvia divinorum TaxID=28513 RepID=A0ABD1FJS5_SALDI